MLTERQHAAVARWWAAQKERRALAREFSAAGFTVAYSCIGWRQLRDLLPDVADVLGASVIQRHRLRP